MKKEYFNSNTGTLYKVIKPGAANNIYICEYGEIDDNGDFIKQGNCCMTEKELSKLDK